MLLPHLVVSFLLVNLGRAYTVTVPDLLEVAEELKLDKAIIKARRSIHLEPEIGLSLPKTEAKIKALLNSLHLEESRISYGWALNKTEGRGYGIVVDFGTGKPPCVLVRADMDALPILERTAVEWQSRIPGAMHACGHDAHSAMLCGVASFLRFQEGRMQGTVRVVFQPGEEGFVGMKWMIEEGLLERFPPPQRALALHVHPAFPSGSFATSGGSVLAGGSHFSATVKGRGGHAAIPAAAIDPVLAAAHIVTAWQSIASRETLGRSARGPTLLSVTQINSQGTASNVIPDLVHLQGTVRAMSPSALEYAKRRALEIARGICAALQCEFSLDFGEFLPNLLNDHQLLRDLQPVLNDVTTVSLEPGEFSYVMEDFAFVSHRIPSVMLFLGVHNPQQSPPTNFSLHHPEFNLDESALIKGSAFLTAAALHMLETLQPAGNSTAHKNEL
eukprot:Gregarina_sp_Pseudo_9__3853@NODE_3_length_7435_cov_15_869389_g2_i0_p3_GENE_NODE_3_length_7435_cov_15_869389_g2_i0NODE_3_length_7435_cov_15_869389_g2_i0_p3_ORF_typecomplete_len445_score98_39Peptidase_M20/PF01546_28/2_8e43M20_dimer/PF07687_14/7_9e14Nup214_FG/PF18617_1/4_8_NODE_3_length_7435_cov_15_869389_g2_i050686402